MPPVARSIAFSPDGTRSLFDLQPGSLEVWDLVAGRRDAAFAGHEPSADDELFEVRKKFGLLFQDGALFGSMNVYDNTCFPLRQHTDKSEGEIEEIVTRRLREVGLAEAMYKMPNELSGGQCQRVAIARALVNNPSLILADEPTGNLDSTTSNEIMEIFGKIQQAGNTVVLVTHEEDIANHARRIVRLRDGLIESDRMKSESLITHS